MRFYAATDGNPSGSGRDQQGIKDLDGIYLEREEEIADRYTDKMKNLRQTFTSAIQIAM